MGKPPSVIIIARHGARLDAVDKQWHLTSPTPYDPPLTYGGWNQARALGTRIKILLQDRENPTSQSPNNNGNAEVEDKASARDDNNNNATPSDASKQPRKQKIIIHASPFLRCVQTAIGVSAGLNQSKPPPLHRSQSSAKHHRLHSGSPLTRGNDSAQLSAIPEPSNSPSPSQRSPEPSDTGVQKYKLRVDAFLGEWLSPDYFEQIAPPPGSVMMVAGAKSELLRRGEPIETGIVPDGKATFGHFPGGWSNPFTSGVAKDSKDDDASENDGAFKHMTAMGYALAHRNRSGSYDSGANGGNKPAGTGISKIITDLPTGYPGYASPTPTYAISPLDPIPTGYVAHARDACVDIDFQWDSMREPQNWGNGGEYGEEWSSMHRRFRNGLERMIDWYETIDLGSITTDEDDSTETVLILITHGAGCNALIGALTGEPVLLDVGVASLTMAVRKEIPAGLSREEVKFITNSRPKRDRVSSDFGDEYEINLLSSTEHLRSGADSSHASRESSPKVLPARIPSYRHRVGANSGSTTSQESFNPSGSIGRKPSNSRMSNSSYSRGYSTGRPSSGLWGSAAVTDDNNSEADDLVPNFGDPKPSAGDNSRAEAGTGTQAPTRTRSQHGLWGSVSLDREPTSKRRWTVNERNS
ncbi:hypothetical protein AJ79_10147 [Helicocarpus griseus UAMH5409]|uniref:Phosphoglycerate mutase n=1 Tax=Helicocarpus griseus UAMH5409 TaxID=1447875 RepID=A0A2B7WFI4_9EURO|nr:hypothetical protein AJ79_10147 [Helicocarpus griseus UAMH5409]